MTLSELCIRRPVMTTLITASIIAFGIFGFRLLPVSALPRVDFPTIAVTATLPGASADTMAASVAGIIERQLSTIAGISSMSSSSSQGTSVITIQFDLNRNIDAAALDVQTALTIAQRRLPVEMIIPPSFRKVNPADFPVLFISLGSATLPLSAVNEYGDITIGQTLSQIPGVAQVQIYGTQKFAIRVQADPEAAAARGLSLEDIRTAVSRANSSTPVGTLNGPKQDVALQASGQMDKAADYSKIVVAWRNGSPVKLDEVARIYESVENEKIATWLNGERAIVLGIQKQPDANTVAVVDAILAKLPALRAQIPPSVTIQVMMDRSISIRQAVADVEETLLIAVALVILVIFLFLRSASATFIPALAVPISLFGTCAVMYALDYSINNMTLLALTLSVGFVVDDAIVMLENIVRHIEHGMRPFEAALKGAREIGFTIISITFSLIAVFIPVLLMGGIVGRVFREFAVTVSVAIIVSGFVSLTLTPMLCARVLRAHDPTKRPNIVLRVFEAMFESWLRAYEWTLDWVLARKPLMLAVTLATLGGTVYLYMIVPKGFFPQEDTGFLIGVTEAATDTSFEAMKERQQALVEVLRVRSRDRIPQLHRRLRRPQPDRELRPPVHCAEAEEGARQPQRDHRPAAHQGPPDTRHAGILPADPEPQCRRTDFQEPVSIRDAERRHRVAVPAGARNARQDREAAGPARRHHRPLHQEPADDGRHRPREGRRSTASPSIRSATSSTTPMARARSAPSTCRRTTTRSSWKCSRSSASIRLISPSST